MIRHIMGLVGPLLAALNQTALQTPRPVGNKQEALQETLHFVPFSTFFSFYLFLSLSFVAGHLIIWLYKYHNANVISSKQAILQNDARIPTLFWLFQLFSLAIILMIYERWAIMIITVVSSSIFVLGLYELIIHQLKKRLNRFTHNPLRCQSCGSFMILKALDETDLGYNNWSRENITGITQCELWNCPSCKQKAYFILELDGGGKCPECGKKTLRTTSSDDQQTHDGIPHRIIEYKCLYGRCHYKSLCRVPV